MASMDYCSILFDHNGTPISATQDFNFFGTKLDAHKGRLIIDGIWLNGTEFDCYKDGIFSVHARFSKNKLFFKLTKPIDGDWNKELICCGITGYGHIKEKKYYREKYDIPKDYELDKEWIDDELKYVAHKRIGKTKKEKYEVLDIKEIDTYIGITQYDIKRLTSKNFLFYEYYDKEMEYVKKIKENTKNLPEIKIDVAVEGHEDALYEVCWGQKEEKVPEKYWKYA